MSNSATVTPFKGQIMVHPSEKANTFSATGWPTATTVTMNAGYFTFTITPTAGFSTTLTSMSLLVGNNNHGPTQFVVRTSLDNFTNNVSTPLTLPSGGNNGNPAATYSFNFGSYLSTIGQTGPIISSVEFRMYAYASATSAELWLQSTSAPGTNAIALTGSVTPVPEIATVLVIVAVAAGLMRLGHRCGRLVTTGSLDVVGRTG